MLILILLGIGLVILWLSVTTIWEVIGGALGYIPNERLSMTKDLQKLQKVYVFLIALAFTAIGLSMGFVGIAGLFSSTNSPPCVETDCPDPYWDSATKP